MSSLYGIKPEPMSLEDQRVMAILLISQHMQRGELYQFEGPALSPKQLQRHLPGYCPTTSIRFSASYSDVDHEVIFKVKEDGNPEPLLEGSMPLSLSDMVLASQGAAISPISSKSANQLFDGMDTFDRPL